MTMPKLITLTDPQSAAAEAYRTLSASGLYYEKPPDDRVRAELYRRLGAFLNEYRKPENQQRGAPRPKDSEVFLLLAFLMRVARHHHNGRPRSRAFLDFLRAQYPPEALGAPEDDVKIDPSVVRGLEYYTGPVFEAELLRDNLVIQSQIVEAQPAALHEQPADAFVEFPLSAIDENADLTFCRPARRVVYI